MTSVAAFKALQLKQYHELFLSKNTRADGRRFDQFRDLIVATKTFESADGSCLVKLGNTTCVGGISATLTEPDEANPKEGFLEMSIELPQVCCPSARFKENRQKTNDESIAITEKLKGIIKESGCFDLEQLCVIENKWVWKLTLQVICLDFDGNYYDACLATVLTVLATGSLPKVSSDGNMETDQPQADQMMNFDENHRTPLDLKTWPSSATFAVFETNQVVADPSYEEEQLATGFINVVWDIEENQLISVGKDGGTAISESQFETIFKDSEKRASEVAKLIKDAK